MTSYTFRIALTSLAMVLCTASSLAQVKKPSQQDTGNASSQAVYFNADGREVVQPGVLTADKVSANSIGDVLTLLLDTAKVSLQSDSDPLNGTWVGTVRVPTRPGAKAPTSYLQHLRGSVDKTGGTRVSVIVNLGGKTFTAEYPYGMKFHGDILRQFVSSVRPRPAESYTATVVILVERRDTKSAVLVSVDSIDVEAKSATKAK